MYTANLGSLLFEIINLLPLFTVRHSLSSRLQKCLDWLKKSLFRFLSLQLLNYRQETTVYKLEPINTVVE
jgi:hypothetical protein